MNKKHLDFNFNIKSINDSGEFSGYGSVFDVKDSYGDIVQKGAFKNSLNNWKEKNRFPSLLWQHDTAEPIGIYTEMSEDETGLFVKGKLLIEGDQLAARAHTHMKAGSISGLSIGYTIPNDGIEYSKENEAYLLKKINLWEVSLVTFPANDQARISDVKSHFIAGNTPDKRLVELILRDAGFSHRLAKAFIADGYEGISQRDADESLEGINKLIQLLR